MIRRTSVSLLIEFHRRALPKAWEMRESNRHVDTPGATLYFRHDLSARLVQIREKLIHDGGSEIKYYFSLRFAIGDTFWKGKRVKNRRSSLTLVFLQWFRLIEKHRILNRYYFTMQFSFSATYRSGLAKRRNGFSRFVHSARVVTLAWKQWNFSVFPRFQSLCLIHPAKLLARRMERTDRGLNFKLRRGVPFFPPTLFPFHHRPPDSTVGGTFCLAASSPFSLYPGHDTQEMSWAAIK